MGKLLISLTCLLLSCSAMHAKTDNDTILVDQPQMVQFIEHPTKNSKGADVVKYYAMYRGELLTTTKSTIEKATLCKKYGAKCKLICIGKRVNGHFQPKRIVVL